MGQKRIMQINIPFQVKQSGYSNQPFCSWDPQVVRAYVQAVLREIETCAADFDDGEIEAVSLEGGNVSLAAPEGLQEILRSVKKNFRCCDDLQISIGLMPGEYSRAIMEKMRDLGVNHWIFRLHTTQLKEFDALGLPYHFDAITMADMAIKTFRPRDLAFEICCGIPYQTKESFLRTLERCLAYNPDHVTIKPLNIEQGSVLAGRIAAGEVEAPGDGIGKICLEAGAAMLSARGLLPYSVCDFCAAGHENRFTLGAFGAKERIGIGYRSVSLIDGVTWTTGHSLQEYIDHSDDIEITACNMVKLSEEDLKVLKEKREEYLRPQSN